MPSGNCLHLFNPLRRDEPSSLRKGLEAALQSKSHPFEQTSMDHIGEWMPIQDAMKIRPESQSAHHLPQTPEENLRPRHLRARGQVLGVACITDNCVGRKPPQQK